MQRDVASHGSSDQPPLPSVLVLTSRACIEGTRIDHDTRTLKIEVFEESEDIKEFQDHGYSSS